MASLNESNYEELAQIPEIGSNLAKEIIAYREKHGKLKDWDELNDLPGFTTMMIKDLQQNKNVSL